MTYLGYCVLIQYQYFKAEILKSKLKSLIKHLKKQNAIKL